MLSRELSDQSDRDKLRPSTCKLNTTPLTSGPCFTESLASYIQASPDPPASVTSSVMRQTTTAKPPMRAQRLPDKRQTDFNMSSRSDLNSRKPAISPLYITRYWVPRLGFAQDQVNWNLERLKEGSVPRRDQ
ncbi:hypothetical protein J6590_020874, partial [Homalodisca vitripennis]